MHRGADINLISAAEFKGLISNIHWRLGKPHQQKKRQNLFIALGLDAHTPDPDSGALNSQAAESRATVSARSRPPALTKRRRQLSGRSTAGGRGTDAAPQRASSRAGVIRVHDSPPRTTKPKSSQELKRTLSRTLPHKGFTFRLAHYGRMKRKKIATIDLEQVDLTRRRALPVSTLPTSDGGSRAGAAMRPPASPAAVNDPYL